QDIYKYAYEIGTKLKYDLREGVKFQFEGYYRDYLAYSEYNPEDLEYDLNMVLRMDVKVTKILSIAPFISMRQAHSRGAENHARNDMIGISFVFSDMFKF
ncbi:MAG: hypothetical protein LBR35_02370, partial [Rickettsiales bacterium]|nr:hypothetical protein [Rickettsiales bacterium]